MFMQFDYKIADCRAPKSKSDELVFLSTFVVGSVSSVNLIIKLQIAVPPSPKAMNWFFSQPLSSAVFPLFFLSKETKKPTYKSLFLRGTRGVFGIGSAVRFMHPSSSTSGGQNSFKRLILLLYLLSLLCHFSLLFRDIQSKTLMR